MTGIQQQLKVLLNYNSISVSRLSELLQSFLEENKMTRNAPPDSPEDLYNWIDWADRYDEIEMFYNLLSN
jgi:hypothetical protein